jgi:hypothetical protein
LENAHPCVRWRAVPGATCSSGGVPDDAPPRLDFPWRSPAPAAERGQERERSSQSPAMPNGRCRMHGGSSTGPTAAGIERIRQARTINGGRSAEMIELRREMAMLRRAARRTIAAVW